MKKEEILKKMEETLHNWDEVVKEYEGEWRREIVWGGKDGCGILFVSG